MDDAFSEYVGMDDFEVIAERHEVSQAIATLTDQYRKLTGEMNRRETLRWMVR